MREQRGYDWNHLERREKAKVEENWEIEGKTYKEGWLPYIVKRSRRGKKRVERIVDGRTHRVRWKSTGKRRKIKQVYGA